MMEDLGLGQVTVLVECSGVYYRARARKLAAKSESFRSCIYEQIYTGAREPFLSLDDEDPVAIKKTIQYCNTGDYPFRVPQSQPQPCPIQNDGEDSTESKQKPWERSIARLLRKQVDVCIIAMRYDVTGLADLAGERLRTILTNCWNAWAFVHFISYAHRKAGLDGPLLRVAYQMTLLHFRELAQRPDFVDMPAPSRYWVFTTKQLIEYEKMETYSLHNTLAANYEKAVRQLKSELAQKDELLKQLEEEVEALKRKKAVECMDTALA